MKEVFNAILLCADTLDYTNASLIGMKYSFVAKSFFEVICI